MPLHRPEDGHLVEVLEGDDRHVGRASAQGRAGGVEGLLRAGVGRSRLAGESVDLFLLEDAQGGAGRVEGDEAAPDHDDAPAEVHPVAAVHVQEVVDRLHDAVQLDAGDVEVAPLRDADREEDGLEAAAAQLGQAVGGRERRAEPESDAEREDPVDLGLDERPREAVLGDPEPHHPARLAPRLEDGHVVAEEGEVVRGREARWSGADDGNARLSRRGRRGGGGDDREVAGVAVPLAHELAEEAVLRVRPDRLDAVPLGDEPLQRADRDGGVDRASTAGVLARRGADPAADRRERVRRAGDEEGLLVTPLRDELDVPAGVGGYRTPGLALDLRLPIRQGRDASPDRHVDSPCARKNLPGGAGPV